MTDPLHQILSDIGGLKAEAAASTAERRLLFAKLDDQVALLASHGRMLSEIKASIQPLSGQIASQQERIAALEKVRHRFAGAAVAAGLMGSALTSAAAALVWVAGKAGWMRGAGN